MTLPAGFPYALNQEVQIPLEQIIPNPDQPRQFEHKEAIELLAASMKAKGQEVAARVRPLTEQERATYPGAWVMLIGGHGRREAALLNQFKTLKCTVEDITPEEAISAAARDNNIRDMHWWEWYLVIEALGKTAQKSQREIANELGQYETKVYSALKVTKTLNQSARDLVRENIQKSLISDARTPGTKNKGFSITENHLLTLAGLEDPNRVQQALQVVLDDYLTADQTKKLVDWVKTGNPADSFNPKAAKANPQRPSAQGQAVSSAAETGSSKSSATTTDALTQTQSAAKSAHHATPAVKASSTAQTVAAETTPGAMAQAAAEMLAGLPLIRRIDAKIKKNEKLTFGEWCLLVLYRVGKVLGWLLKFAVKVAHGMIKWFWKRAKEATENTLKALGHGIYGGVKIVVSVAFVLLMIWEAYAYFFQHDALGPMRTIVSWAHPEPKAKDNNVPTEKVQSAVGTTNGATPVSASTPVPAAAMVQVSPTTVPPVQKAQVTSAPTDAPEADQPATLSQAPTANAKANSDKPLAQAPLAASPLTPTVTPKPKGDLINQAAGAADAVNAVRHLLPF